MIGFLFKFRKKQPPPVTTISLEKLAKIWRDPVKPENVVKKEKIPEPMPKNESSESKPTAVDLTALIGTDQKPPTNNNGSWFDEKAMLATLQKRISKGRTSAFVYQGIAYHTLETVTGALNQQRKDRNLKPLEPNEVIAFFKSESERGLKNGKYLLRFDKGLPLKVYLYTHPVTNKEVFESPLPVEETGRRLKSLKPVKEHAP